MWTYKRLCVVRLRCRRPAWLPRHSSGNGLLFRLQFLSSVNGAAELTRRLLPHRFHTESGKLDPVYVAARLERRTCSSRFSDGLRSEDVGYSPLLRSEDESKCYQLPVLLRLLHVIPCSFYALYISRVQHPRVRGLTTLLCVSLSGSLHPLTSYTFVCRAFKSTAWELMVLCDASQSVVSPTNFG